MKKQKDSIILTGARARKAEKFHREMRAIIEKTLKLGGLSRTEREYRSTAQVGMTLAEIREGRLLPMPYTVVSEKRGDLWDFTTRREAENFIFLMELEDRDNHDYKEGRYTVRENVITEEQRKAYIAETMRLLGQTKSTRKAAASRANGKKGGRPRKEE